MKLIKTLAVVLSLSMPTTLKAQSSDFCLYAGQVLFTLASARDAGLAPVQGFSWLLSIGVPNEIAETLVNVVWVVNPQEGPVEIKDTFIDNCLGVEL